MRRRINVIVAAVVVLLVAGLVLAAIPKVRQAADRTRCQNNLKQVGKGLLNYHDAYRHFPQAALPNDALPCDKRFSWLVDTLPYIEQMDGLALDREKPWDAEPNRIPMARDYADRGSDEYTLVPLGEVKFLRCPVNPSAAPADSPALTDYVGVSGIGRDVAELDLGYPGTGVFGCQRRTKIEDIKDGLSNTIMVMETSTANGPWTAGGFPTTRGLDPDGGPYLGAGGQFGSGHRSWGTVTTNVVYADGSVRSLKESVSPEVLEALATVAGGETVGPYEE